MRIRILLLLLLLWDYSSKQNKNCDGFSIHIATSRHPRLVISRDCDNNNYNSISAVGDAYVSSSSSSFWRIHLSLKDDEDNNCDHDNNSNSNTNDDDDEDDDNHNQQQQQQPTFDAEQPSNRIKEVKKSESRMNDQFTSGLQQRVQELQSSKAIEELLFNNDNDNNNDSNNNDNNDVKLSLPVIIFDALLPQQKLEGSTEDTTFIKFLINEIGLGGYFMMTSLEYKSRKIRRNGVVCKIEFLNAASATTTTPAAAMTSISNNDFLPTSVNFVIVGKKRCRVAVGNKANSKNKDLKLRIGRWRRCYDENCEESQLGWGVERFKDIDVVVDDDDNNNNNGNDDNEIIVDQASPTILPSSSLSQPTDPKEWNKIEIEYRDLDNNNVNDSNNDNDNIASNIEKVESLIPYVDEWYNLASNIKTYQNLNVTVTARIQWDQPYLTIEPEKLLRRVTKELGPRPNATTITTTNTNTNNSNSNSNSKKVVNVEFIFWVAALINPLPALGVSLEIRGNILEANTITQKLQILELGLMRSIQNLKGERRL